MAELGLPTLGSAPPTSALEFTDGEARKGLWVAQRNRERGLAALLSRDDRTQPLGTSF